MNIKWLFQSKRRFVFLFTSIIAVVVFNLGIASQAAGLQFVPEEQPWIAKNLSPINPLPETNRLNLAIALPLRNQSALSNLLLQIYDPASPNYHRYLTPAEFAAKFGPSASDYQAVIDFARQNGFQVTGTHRNRLLVDVNATVPVIENALHVKMHTYRHPTENRMFYAPDAQPTIDLGVPVLRISGLDSFSLPHPLSTFHPLFNGQNAVSNLGSGLDGSYLGNDFRAAYVPNTTLTGSGQRVGLVEFDGYTSNDITYYETEGGLPAVILTNVLIDGYNGQANGYGVAEVSLDIEMAIAMAPGLSQIIVYEASNDETSAGWHDLLNRMATDDLAKQLSCSWYIPGGTSDPVANGIWQEMAAQGQSFLTASGDSDAYTGLIPFPGDSPYITVVGGTELSTTGPGGSWTSETVWNVGGEGSSGGISTQYPIPNWQTNVSMAVNQGSTTMRNIPDVAMTADNIYIRSGGEDLNAAGTSCAAPLWAGFIALVNQEATAGGHSAVGFLNPLVYAIGAKANYSTYFHDITTGNNESESSPTMFSAVAGYDLCTGWGTPAGQKLIDALANPESLVITPLTGFSSIGAVHGPFSITSQSFILTNAGSSSLNWSLANTSSWLNVSSTGGTLAAAGPAASVIVSLNTLASNLPVGIYNATLSFTNLNDNFSQQPQFTLDILSPPVITLQPTNQNVLDGQNAAFSVRTSGGVPQYYQWQLNGTNLSDGGGILGSSTTNLVIDSVSVANVGAYTLVVSNVAGIVISSNAILSLIPSAPIITVQPTNVTVDPGSTAQFSVAVVGTKPISYQWTFDMTNIAGATGATLVLPNVQSGNAGNYAVEVTNIYGATNSYVVNLTLLSCDPPPSGLVGWWKGDGNALDSSAYANNGTVVDEGYTNGIVGEAFEMDPENWPYGTYNAIDIPDAPQYNLTNAFTIEAWIRPRGNGYTIFQRSQVGNYSAYDLDMQANNVLRFYIANYANSYSAITAPLAYNVWWHIAATFNNGVMVLYTNGVVAAQTTTTLVPMGVLTNSPGLAIGNNLSGENNFPFWGDVDELSLYNRALSQSEIEAIYNAGSEGKCVTLAAPTITTQPTNQTVYVGQTASFSVTAMSTTPVNFQWQFDGTNILNATNATLMLADVQLNNAGNYAVVVSNAFESVLSSNAVLIVNASSCDSPPSGLVGWWKGDGNALDSSGYHNNGTVADEGYTNGVVGEAFEMDPEDWPYGTYNAIDIPDAPQYNLTNAFTIETWIRPRGNGYTIFQRSQDGYYAAYALSMEGNNTLQFYIANNANTYASITTPLAYNIWWHIAATYSNGVMIIYTNGVVAAQTTTPLVPMGTLNNSPGVGIGNNNQGENNFPFIGDIDEMSLYNRALSQSEIDAIYNAGGSGKCLNLTPPVITTQPTNQTVFVGQTASFSVSANGTGPLYYQWTFDAANIAGATNTILVLPNVQLTNAGNYAVVVSNAYDSLLSSNAVLTVNASSCDSPPSGLVGWWKGDGNALDSSGYHNNGTVVDEGYTNGVVGEAFEMDPEDWPYGTYNAIDIPDAPQYNLTNAFTIETWVRPRGNGYTILDRCQAGYYPAYDMTMEGDNILSFNIANSANTQCVITTPLVYNVWTHIAGTYSNGVMIIYTNGVVAAQTTTPLVPMGTLNNNPGLGIGNINDGGDNYPFIGDIDEMSLYNRALSQSEIDAIYNAGGSGKCLNLTPPVITTQPTNQTVFVGQTASFSVTAMSTTPVNFQWQFDGTNILNATNATLTLVDVQLNNAGVYDVTVTNMISGVISSNAVLAVNASACDPPPSGLVGWWKGDGNAWDSSGYHNNGTVVDEGYTNGIVGEAFEMDPEDWPNGTYNAVEIPDAPQYVLTNAFTMEAWIRPRGNGYTIFQRAQVGFYSAYALGMGGDNTLYFSIADDSNNYFAITTALAYNLWWHIAATYSNGVMTLYTNGVVAAQTTTMLVPMGILNPNNSPGMTIGNNLSAENNFPFIGDVDEMSLYNRALSQSEIQAIYNAGSEGKCVTLAAPTITSQPTNQTVYVGQTASFSVTAMSTTPVNFQWQFDGTNILDATNATLMLVDVQLNNAGVYDVTVTNMIGGVISSNAVLTISPLTHFAWGSIPSPRFLSVPFPVTIMAQNATNGTVLTYNNSVMLYTTNAISLSPAFSGNFVQGVWTGTVVVAQTGTNVVLEADDGQGHTGLSNPLNILALPTLSLQSVGPILLLDWPMDYDSFELEESSNLYPANWLPVPVSPLQIGNQYIVPLEMAGTNGFYRLQFQGP